MQRSSVNDSARENMAAIAKWSEDTNGTLLSAGTAAAYTLTTNAADTLLADTSLLVFRAHLANLASPTLNRDGVGAKAIKTINGTALPADTFAINQMVAVSYNPLDDSFTLLGAQDIPTPVPSTGGLVSIQTFTTSGTWTKPGTLLRVKVVVVGGGGGGGGAGSDNANGGGGGGGGCAIELIEEASLGATEVVTVGTGGAGGTAGNNAGGAGVTSSFGAHCSATGGAGGAAATGSGSSAGGNGSGGNIDLEGGQGDTPNVGISTRPYVGRGGAAAGPYGGPGAATTGAGAGGRAGRVAGGGGGGGIRTAATSRGGGAGADGIVIVWEYA